jgi:alpha-glucosidase (family GH31 glycosyl hydrolase)
MTFPENQIPFEPLADPAAVVMAPGARFTILTPRLVRMEYSATEVFEDRPSQAFWFRRQPAPEFSVKQSEERLEIDTAYLLLTYWATGRGFTPGTLSVLVKSTGQTWLYGDLPGRGQNLEGTARTLDESKGEVLLEPGLMGRDGWAVVDDSHSLVFNPSGWLEARQADGNLDLYFFGYGHDYTGCLRDFCLVAGEAPLIPRWALGNWWSRYWAYSQDELLALMEEFKKRETPLSVCIVDMDWHLTETGNHCTGWTGYTWNEDLFPDAPGFIDQLHEMGLKTALNLHPAEGIHPHEAQYPALAEWMGLEPERGEPIRFDPSDPHFMQGYFELLHHPYEAMGVDFWWVDWQQGAQTRVPGLDPLWWLNHLHFHDLGRDGKKRPFIFSRWGGLGNHRYPIGFSGDTVVSWEALDFQPTFTASAANVGYGWWSHDIGGHMGGIEDDELYARWVQYGVFSPILRLHCTNVRYHERLPWRRGLEADRAATAAMRLRHQLIPYLYSMNWRYHTTGIPLVTPMYYSHAENPGAYECPQQYWFGSELLAAPFTRPAQAEVGLSRQSLWLPDGMWFNFFSGEPVQGGKWASVYGDLQEIPVYAKAGAIVPLDRETGWGGVANPDSLEVFIFPGADNRFELVEDDGETTDYQRGKYAVTVLSQEWREDELTFTIHPARGDLSIIPAQRAYALHLRGVAQPGQLDLKVNGGAREGISNYDPETETVSLVGLLLTPEDELTLTVRAENGKLLGGKDRSSEKLRRMLSAFRMNTWVKARIEQIWPGIAAGEIALRSHPEFSDAQINALRSLLLQG